MIDDKARADEAMFPRAFLFAAREVDQHAQHDEEHQKQRHRQGRHQRQGFRDAGALRVRLACKDGHALQRHEAHIRADVLVRAPSRGSAAARSASLPSMIGTLSAR
jgi:hypothetical protein